MPATSTAEPGYESRPAHSLDVLAPISLQIETGSTKRRETMDMDNQNGMPKKKPRSSTSQADDSVERVFGNMLENYSSVLKPKVDRGDLHEISVENLISCSAMGVAQMSEKLLTLGEQASAAEAATTWLSWLYDFLYGCLLILNPNFHPDVTDTQRRSARRTRCRATNTIKLAACLHHVIGANYLSVFHVLASK